MEIVAIILKVVWKILVGILLVIGLFYTWMGLGNVLYMISDERDHEDKVKTTHEKFVAFNFKETCQAIERWMIPMESLAERGWGWLLGK